MWLRTAERAGRQLFVAFKVAEACNIACKYCYFFEKEDQSYIDSPRVMPDHVLTAAAQFLAHGARDLEIPTVSIAIHGGEPLLIGKRRFERVCNILRETISPHARLVLGVQTNGLLLDPEWIEVLSRTGCAVGVSVDGPREIHDAGRVDKKGRGTFDRVKRAIALLNSAVGAGRLPGFGVLSVVHPELSARDAYDFFVGELGVKRLYFRPPSMTWDQYDPHTARQVQAFLVDLFRIWAAKDDASVAIRPNVDALLPFIHDTTAVSRVDSTVDLAHAISIRSNGDVCPDDSLPPLSMRFRDRGFNVHNHSLAEFYEDDIWNEIHGSITDTGSECRGCEWFGVCGGGALSDRYSEATQFRRRSVYCDGYRALFDCAAQYASRSIGLEAVHRRKAAASEALMSVY